HRHGKRSGRHAAPAHRGGPRATGRPAATPVAAHPGQRRRLHDVVRRAAPAGAGHLHRHAGSSPPRPPCPASGPRLGGRADRGDQRFVRAVDAGPFAPRTLTPRTCTVTGRSLRTPWKTTFPALRTPCTTAVPSGVFSSTA